MDSSQDFKSQKDGNIETSFDLTATAGPSTVYENSEFLKSCPTILEPSKDRSRSQEEIYKNPFEIFSSQPNPPALPFVPALVGTDSIPSFYMLTRTEQGNCCLNCCSAIYNCYSRCAIVFRNSRFFYIIQLLFSLLPLSTIAMGIKYSQDCKLTFPVLTLIIGIFGILFFGVWISINVFHHRGRRCTGQQKFLVRLLFGILTILLSIEIALYYSTEMTFNPNDKSYCSKIFIDFTLFKYIAIAGSLCIATILYIPDFSSFICSFECTMPIASANYDDI